MTRRLILAVSHAWEGELVERLGASTELVVVRRCADLADLLGAGAAGLADVALVSADLRQLDRMALDHLATHGVRTAGVTAPGDEAADRRLRQLGLTTVFAHDIDVDQIESRLASPDLGLSEPVPDEPAATARHGDEEVVEALRASGPGTATPRGARGDGPVAGGRTAGARATSASDEPFDPSAGRGRLIAVWGPTGAPGRSTVALNLAAELAREGLSTLLVDLDTYGSSLAQALSLLDEAPGVAAAARASEQGTLDLPALNRIAPSVSPGLRILTGLPRPERWPELRSGAVEHVLMLARELCDVTVLDCGFGIEDDEVLSYDTLAPRRNAATLTALARSDTLLVVGTGDPVGLQRLVRAVQEVGPIPSPRPRVVVNRVRASAVGSRPERRITEALSRFAGMDEVTYLPMDVEALDLAMLAGRTLAEAAPSSPLRVAIADLAASLLPPTHEPRSRRGRRAART